MKINAWISAIFISIFVCILLFFGIDNNSETIESTPIDLDSVTNQQLEEVVQKNPSVLGMRMSLANRYLSEGNFSNALTHFVYIATNDTTNEFKPTALSQIGWMSYESGKTMLALEYIKESIRLSPNNILGNTYLGIILLEQDFDKEEGLKILKKVLTSSQINSNEKEIVSQYIARYEE
jgi:tetratricopeptide (TPR) repeat protein